MHVWLIGMMGSGKSSVAKMLASKWKVPAVDLDREIERAAHSSIAAIFRTRGEPAFRALEEKAVAKAASSRTPAVIATGGGAVLSDANVSAMRTSGRVIWLDAPVSVLRRRVGKNLRTRPLAANLAKLASARRPRYARSADHCVDAGRGSVAAVTARVREALEAPLVYSVDGEHTEIHVGVGALARTGALVRERIGGSSGLAVVVTDQNVYPLHAGALARSLRAAGYRVVTLSIRPGEKNKNAESMKALWEGHVRARVDRKTPVIALGGGVLGDLAGFASATILRGVPFVQVPTTLIAQVDSAIGGKTGFDLPAGKNLVGAFKQPALVVADPSTLRTLPEAELRAGLAEVVKYGVIADAELFEELERAVLPLSLAALERIVRRSAAIKARVVEKDPRERGLRAILNYGHTAGHALEAASGYRVRHGEAVAAGMVAEALLASSRGACAASDVERLAALVARLGLPHSLPAKGAERFLASDKKRVGAKVRLPVLRRIGHVELQELSLYELRSLFRSKGRTR